MTASVTIRVPVLRWKKAVSPYPPNKYNDNNGNKSAADMRLLIEILTPLVTKRVEIAGESMKATGTSHSNLSYDISQSSLYLQTRYILVFSTLLLIQ